VLADPGVERAYSLMDLVATEVAMFFPIAMGEDLGARAARVQRAFRREGLFILAAMDHAIETEAVVLSGAPDPGLQFPTIHGSTLTPPPRQAGAQEVSMSIPVQVRTPARGHHHNLRLVVFAAAAAAIAFSLYVSIFGRPEPRLETATLRYVYSNPNGCKVFRSVRGATKGSIYIFCAPVGQ
jgi:hypothetical protein